MDFKTCNCLPKEKRELIEKWLHGYSQAVKDDIFAKSDEFHLGAQDIAVLWDGIEKMETDLQNTLKCLPDCPPSNNDIASKK